MIHRADSIREMRSLFQAGEGGSTPTSALQLRFDRIELADAKPLNRLWHSRFPEVGGGGSRICHVATYDQRAYAVAIWTNPTAPKLPQVEWLMLKRFAIAPDRPANTASRMMGWMVRDVSKRFSEVRMLVSYSDPASHEGTIYRSTGWICDGVTPRGESKWQNRERNHTENDPCENVARWLYPVHPDECDALRKRLEDEQRKHPGTDEAESRRAEADLRLLERRAAVLRERRRVRGTS